MFFCLVRRRCQALDYLILRFLTQNSFDPGGASKASVASSGNFGSSFLAGSGARPKSRSVRLLQRRAFSSSGGIDPCAQGRGDEGAVECRCAALFGSVEAASVDLTDATKRRRLACVSVSER